MGLALKLRTSCSAIALSLALFLTLPSLGAGAIPQNAVSPRDLALQRLLKEGFSHRFIQVLNESYVEEDRDRIVELNILGFLARADYSGHYSARAIRKCREFLKKYGSTLRAAERLYKVPPEVIAALLWVETKHGLLLGRFPVTSVYFSLLQADHPEVMEKTLASAKTRVPASDPDPAEKVRERSQAKAQWALGELKSLERIYKKSERNKAHAIRRLVGSYAGAFGIPQFIPTSYLRWAASQNHDPDLFEMRDAIFSVASYLSANGWKKSSPKSHREALFHYNRSQGYGEVILKIAKEVRTK